MITKIGETVLVKKMLGKNIKKSALLGLCISAMYSNVQADEMAELKAQMQAMQKQMQMMQQKLDAQQEKLDRQAQHSPSKAQVSANDSGIKAIAHEMADSLTISGGVVVNTSHTDSDGWGGESTSDIILDTLELAVDTQVTPWVNGHILFLYEQDGEDDGNLTVDEAIITIGNSEASPFYLSAGRMFVPFGNFESRMISDPITLTMAETREEAVQLGFELENGFGGSAYLFNGSIDEANSSYTSVSNSHIDNFGFNLGYAMSNEQLDLSLGMGYINNIGTTDGIQDIIGDNGLCAGDGCVKDYVGGLAFHAVAGFGQVTLMGEYITALDDFAAGEIGTDKMQPKTWSIEAAYDFSLAGKDASIALGYQGSDEFYLDGEATDYFEKAWLVGMNVDIYKNTTLSVEWRHARAASEVEDAIEAAGDKYDDENLLQMNLSIAF